MSGSPAVPPPSGPEPIPQFGEVEDGAVYMLRPGGYAIVVDGPRMVTVESPRRLTLPGGGQDPDESPEAAAVRETAEECGLRIVLEEPLGIADEMIYSPEERRHFRKRCSFFLARVTGTAVASEPDHHLVWMEIDAAMDRLTDASQRWALSRARQALALRGVH